MTLLNLLFCGPMRLCQKLTGGFATSNIRSRTTTRNFAGKARTPRESMGFSLRLELNITFCNAEQRFFQPGESVLVFLPIPGSVLHARFAGHYVVEKKLSDTDYVICTQTESVSLACAISIC